MGAHFHDGYAYEGTDFWVNYDAGVKWPEAVPPPGCAGCRSVYYYQQDGHTIQAITADYANGTAASCQAEPTGAPIAPPDLAGAVFNGSYVLRGVAVDQWIHNDFGESFWTQACDGSSCGKQSLMREVFKGGSGTVEYFGHVDDTVMPEEFPEVPAVCGASRSPAHAIMI